MSRRRGATAALLASLGASSLALNPHLHLPAGTPAPRRPAAPAPPPVRLAVGELVLGLDGGYATCGWGVVEVARRAPRHLAHGAQREPPGRDPLQRAIAMALRIVPEARAAVGGRPVVVVAERWDPRLSAPGTQVQAHRVGLGVGALAAALALGLGGRAALGHGPSGARAALGLPPGAPKRDVRERVAQLLRLAEAPSPEHAADALALAAVAALLGVAP